MTKNRTVVQESLSVGEQLNCVYNINSHPSCAHRAALGFTPL